MSAERKHVADLLAKRLINVEKVIQSHKLYGYKVFSSGDIGHQTSGVVAVFYSPQKLGLKELIVEPYGDNSIVNILISIMEIIPEKIKTQKDIYESPETQTIHQETILRKLPTSVLILTKNQKNEPTSLLFCPIGLEPIAALYELRMISEERNLSIH